MSTSDAGSRMPVKTYVPKEQKRIWEDHADEMEMTMSEYIRTMVQSGRSPFTVEKTRSPDANPQGNDLESAILDNLENDAKTFDELSENIIGDLEEELDQVLMELEQVKYSGRTGEYRLVE